MKQGRKAIAAEDIWSRNEYAGVYSRLEDFAPKKLHDMELAGLISELAMQEELASAAGPLMLGEVGAGPAPVSRLLHEDGFSCVAFDCHPDMAAADCPVPYETSFDLTHPEITESEKGKYHVVVMENVWYATTISPEGTRNYTKEEAKLMRLTALKKAAALLQPGGYLVLSEPVEVVQNMGFKKIYDFIKIDREARKTVYNENKGVGGIILEYLKDPQIREIIIGITVHSSMLWYP